MKFLTILIVFACLLVFPVFSQETNDQRYQALSDSMGRTLDSSNSRLDYYRDAMNDSGAMKGYASYRGKYSSLLRRLNETEIKLDLLIRTNDRTVLIEDEVGHYESIIDELESTKSDYDRWLRDRR